MGGSINTHITFIIQKNICEWIGLVMPGLAVLERVGARGHFGKCTPDPVFRGSGVTNMSSLTGHHALERFL